MASDEQAADTADSGADRPATDTESSAELIPKDLPGESNEELPPERTGLVGKFGTLTRRSTARLPALRSAMWAALRPRLARLAASLAAGGLLYTSFPALNWWWAAIVTIALLSWVLTRRATTPAGGMGYGFLFGMAFYVPLLPWISTLVGDMPWLVLATMSACFPALFGLCAVVVRALPGWPIWFAVLWGAMEWLKSVIPFGGFPWGSIAFGQAQGPLLPLVQLGGVPLLSSSVVLVGASVTAIALEIVVMLRTGRAAAPRESQDGEQGEAAGKPPAVVLPGISICLVLLTAVLVWPQVRHAGAGSGGEPSITVAVVQGNVPRLGLEFNSQRRAVLDYHVTQTMRLAQDVRAGLAPQPHLVIWPENSSDIDPFVNSDAGQEISAAADAIGAPILVGTLLPVPGQSGDDTEFTNTMIVWNPHSGPAERHDKAIVQPFGEYMPMRWLFRYLSDFADRAGHFVPVQGSGLVHMAGVPVGVSTCWEVVFDRAPRNSVLNGAQLLTVPSNNATFTKAMSEQQLAFAKVRAVEHDRYVLVAGTTGISAVIAPDGGELTRTDFFVPDYIDMPVRLKTNLTPATRWAPILQWLLVAAAGVLILVAIRQNGWPPGWLTRRRRRSGPADEPDDDVAAVTPSAESDDPDARAEADNAPANVDPANDALFDEGSTDDETHTEARTGPSEGAT